MPPDSIIPHDRKGHPMRHRDSRGSFPRSRVPFPVERAPRRGVRRAWLVLVSLVLPFSLVFATPAHAANLNAWKQTVVTVGPVARAVDCWVTSRYTENGLGMEWGTGECRGPVDLSPFQSGTYGEPGNGFTLTFKGTRAGQETFGEGEYVGSESCGWSTAAVSVTCDDWRLSAKYASRLSMFGGDRYVSLFAINANAYSNPVDAYAAGATKIEDRSTWDRQTPSDASATRELRPYKDANGNTLVKSVWVAPGINPGWAGEQDLRLGEAVKIGTLYVTPNGGTLTKPTGNAGGVVGEGVPCKASGSGVLGAHPDNGLMVRGTLPSGSGAFPDEPYGSCDVTEVCLTLTTAGLPGTGGGEESNCTTANFGKPYSPGAPVDPDNPPLTSDEPPPVVPEDLPVPETEGGFWAAVVRLLTGIWGAIKSVGAAIAAVPGLILDGLSGLFVPSPGYLDARVGEVRSMWDNTTPVKYLNGFTSLVPGSVQGCEGIPFTFDMPGVGASGVSVGTKYIGAACTGNMADIAGLVRVGISAAVVIGGGLACVRALGSGFGWNPNVGGSTGA